MEFSRRQVIAAAGSAVLLAACGDDAEAKPWSLVQRFPSEPLMVPGENRLPVSLSIDGGAMVADGPATLSGWIEAADDARTRITEVTAVRRNSGITTPYWEVRATLPDTGSYALRLDGDDGFGANFTVYSPADVNSPLIGTELPPFDTPTVDDHRGVEPYCSLTPEPCPLHAMTLTDALALGKPLAYMVGTPAHCSTGTCTPGLQFLVAEQERVGDKIVMVHADVYADNAATTVAPAVDALGVQYEPIIYFCTADGNIVDRLDAIWDASELTERIDALLAR